MFRIQNLNSILDGLGILLHPPATWSRYLLLTSKNSILDGLDILLHSPATWSHYLLLTSKSVNY